MIYTGYFARLKTYKEAGLVPVSVTRWTPKWFEGKECKALAPSADLLARYKNGITNTEAFTEEFEAMLDSIDIKKVLEDLTEEGSTDIVLLCFEKNGDFCHRHIIAKHLKSKYDITVEEFPV